MTKTTRTILLADDDMDDLELLEECFLQIDPSLKIFKILSGKKAVEALVKADEESFPDLIVLDYNMPDLTGAEVLDAIYNDERYRNIPRLIWSTSDSSMYEQICRDKGATHYFKKPHSVDEVQSLAKKILGFL